MRLNLAALLIALFLPLGAMAAKGPAPIAVFDADFVNTSLEPVQPAETARLQRLGEQLRAALDRSGQYRVVDLTPIQGKIAAMPPLTGCNGCERGLARQAGARLVALTWVQKVSNLILNINIKIEDVASGALIKAGSVDIRGNTDESWDRGLAYLLKEHVFVQEPPPAISAQ